MAAQNHPPSTAAAAAATTTTSTVTSSSRATTSSSSLPPRPTIKVPERSSLEGLFKGGMSPGPMTLVASFFNDQESENEYRSFSQLLAGAMASPKAAAFGSTGGPGFKPGSFALGPPSPLLTIPPGLSPTFLLDSPGFWSPGPFAISHQQALAHVTAQAFQAQTQMHPPVPPVQNYPSSQPPVQNYPSSQPPVQNYPPSQLSASVASAQNSLVPLVHPVPLQQWPPRIPEPETKAFESGGVSSSDKRPQQTLIPIDKPADDGYNWRKYGQKAVKGSECPRSYYKCTNPGCPVKKKVERSVEGHVTEIIYKGQHNHEPPPVSKRGKDGGSVEVNGTAGWPVKSESGSQIYSQALDGQSLGKDSDAMDEQSSGSSDGAEVNEDACGKGEEIIDDEPEAKRRSIDSSNAPTASTQRTITEPRIVVQTTSEVDLLDDGYRWRKYGQKVVKGNPHPRSYYKCTNAGCNVRKHVERASTDAKAVITTYEGKHNHDVPATRHSSHHTANPNGNSGEITIAKQQPILTKPATLKMLSFAGNQQQQTLYQHQGSSMLRPKEER